MSDATIDQIEPTYTRSRRGPLGRLYHGETAIDFYGRRWWGLGLSAILILISLTSIFTRGLNLGIDFKGGVAWEISNTQLSVSDARQVLSDNNLDGNNAKVIERTSQAGRSLLLQVGDEPQEVRQQVQTALATAAGQSAEQVSTTSVSATWGKSITEKAIRALIVFFILVALYISWQLEWKMALTSIIAMLHDVLISVGVYSVLQWDVTPATVVSFLTILGFSLYDTIVVFDKVRENAERFSGSRVPYADVINTSMNQVLMRSLNTNISAVLPVLSLLILGSEVMGAVTLREFSLALLVGLITGSYSSIFIATPLLAIWKEREPKYAPYRNRHAVGADLEHLVLGGSALARREAKSRGGASASTGVADAEPPKRATTPGELLTHPPRPRKKKRRA